VQPLQPRKATAYTDGGGVQDSEIVDSNPQRSEDALSILVSSVGTENKIHKHADFSSKKKRFKR